MTYEPRMNVQGDPAMAVLSERLMKQSGSPRPGAMKVFSFTDAGARQWASRWWAHRVHERYLRERKTGMEPWFEFWATIRYAADQARLEFRRCCEYGRSS